MNVQLYEVLSIINTTVENFARHKFLHTSVDFCDKAQKSFFSAIIRSVEVTALRLVNFTLFHF